MVFFVFILTELFESTGSWCSSNMKHLQPLFQFLSFFKNLNYTHADCQLLPNMSLMLCTFLSGRYTLCTTFYIVSLAMSTNSVIFLSAVSTLFTIPSSVSDTVLFIFRGSTWAFLNIFDYSPMFMFSFKY